MKIALLTIFAIGAFTTNGFACMNPVTKLYEINQPENFKGQFLTVKQGEHIKVLVTTNLYDKRIDMGKPIEVKPASISVDPGSALRQVGRLKETVPEDGMNRDHYSIYFKATEIEGTYQDLKIEVMDHSLEGSKPKVVELTYTVAEPGDGVRELGPPPECASGDLML